MATSISPSVKKLVSQAKSAGARAATARAKEEGAKALKAMRDRYNKHAPALKKEILEAYGLPVISGVGGALVTDFALGRFQIFSGARGDILKGVTAVGVGVLAKKYVKSPYLHDAAVGAGVVAVYKLVNRIMNRAGADMMAAKSGAATPAKSKLAGLFDGKEGDQDLAGYCDNNWMPMKGLGNAGEMSAVMIQLPTGEQGMGYADAAGRLYDGEGQPLLESSMNGLGSTHQHPVSTLNSIGYETRNEPMVVV